MIISEISIKNFKSYGNSPQVLKLNKDKGELILLAGGNGMGKCVDRSTLIEIDIDDIFLSVETIFFLYRIEVGRKFLFHIKENKPLLYQKIEEFKHSMNK